jgi:threonylcarbamoyladenosine tRNA methylthiotransferase MtaB
VAAYPRNCCCERQFSAAFYTLGCKLNQLETESVADAFRREGFAVHDAAAEPLVRSSPPDIIVVNTCTVTGHAEQKARRLIRKALRDNPRACILVTGCYAQLEAQAIAALDGGEGESVGPNEKSVGPNEDAVNERPSSGQGSNRLFVLPGDKKDALLDLPKYLAFQGNAAQAQAPTGTLDTQLPSLIQAWMETTKIPAPAAALSVSAGEPAEAGVFRFKPLVFTYHSRASLKIQDGCDNHCTYCRVRLARGASRSLSAERALSSLQDLEKNGYNEAVITGVNINQYNGGTDLAGLLGFLLSNTTRIRVRLSSIEPDGMSPALAEVLAHPRIRPHFHLSVQSGSAGVLKRMARLYGPQQVEDGVRLLRQAKGDPFLACDMITGFPGETPEDFEASYELCRRIGFAWIHAFPYSPRPGTAAFSFKRRVSEREAGQRVERLTALARRGRQDYVGRFLGAPVEAIVENTKEKIPGHAAALSDNYIRLLVDVHGSRPAPGSLIYCRLTRAVEPEPGEGTESRFDAFAEIIR